MRGRESVTSKRIAYRVWVHRSKCVKLNFVDKPVCLSSAAWTVLGEQTKLAATRRSSMFKSGLIFVFGSVPLLHSVLLLLDHLSSSSVVAFVTSSLASPPPSSLFPRLYLA